MQFFDSWVQKKKKKIASYICQFGSNEEKYELINQQSMLSCEILSPIRYKRIHLKAMNIYEKVHSTPLE